MSKHIMVVDGNEGMRELLENSLSDLGYTCECYGDFVEACKLLDDELQLGNKGPKSKFDLAMVDLNMIRGEAGTQPKEPRMANFLVHQLSFLEVPVIRITGTPQQLQGKYGLGGEIPPVAVLDKPFTIADMTAVLESVFGAAV